MFGSASSKRIAVGVTALLLVALVLGVGPAAAHTPSGLQTGGPGGGPHYDGDGGTQTASQTAYDHNPTLGGSFNDHAVESCTVGHAQADRVDC